MSGLMLHLTRLDGSSISINGGSVHSVEEVDGHTVVVCGDDVYHIREKRSYIEAILNDVLNEIVINRLKAMEADPSWAKVFRQEVMGKRYWTDAPMSQMDQIKVYKKIASEYALYKLEKEDKMAELYNRAIERLKDAPMYTENKAHGYNFTYYTLDDSSDTKEPWYRKYKLKGE